MDIKYENGTRVRITRGKNKGMTARISYMADPHHLSSERRFYLVLDNRKDFFGKSFVLMNESGFYVIRG
ncbi:hypothetical protein [Escherichia phage vB_EcoM-LTH01]